MTPESKPGLYRSRPVKVQAWFFDGTEYNGHQIAAWSGGMYTRDGYGKVYLPPGRGRYAAPGEWVVEIEDSFRIVSAEAFPLMYEWADE